MAIMLMKSAIAQTKFDEEKKTKEQGIDKTIIGCRIQQSNKGTGENSPSGQYTVPHWESGSKEPQFHKHPWVNARD
jgi:hypothetical protein